MRTHTDDIDLNQIVDTIRFVGHADAIGVLAVALKIAFHNGVIEGTERIAALASVTFGQPASKPRPSDHD